MCRTVQVYTAYAQVYICVCSVVFFDRMMHLWVSVLKAYDWLDQSEGCGRLERRLGERQCDLVVEEGCMEQCGVRYGSHRYTHKYTLSILRIDSH